MVLKRVLAFAFIASTAVYAATFDVTFSTAGHDVPPTLYGLMFEITASLIYLLFLQSGDGGLYAELIQNRAFQTVTPVPDLF
ncbi:hypothetical protein DFH05DRAFT_1526875 [Lentinula detonsa]|uniref:Uncharacterized protein n=1 Tax=Lentinula detonsa TaxID=2804962 RepID=A0A9W8NWL5_9AGAR|nr:hypothetical protein DFH05DRAFT_1526875 [Lentinula detonsa]